MLDFRIACEVLIEEDCGWDAVDGFGRGSIDDVFVFDFGVTFGPAAGEKNERERQRQRAFPAI
jgi:hypothetical protein